MHRLVVFDWDGTLMDSEAKIVASAVAAAADLGLPPLSRERVRDIIGLGLPEAVARLFPEADPTTARAYMDQYRHHFLEADTTPMPLFEGVEEVLGELDDRGYLLAVATGKARRGLDRVLAETGLGGRFVATRCADETFSKPHPQMLMELMDLAGTSAAETLMVGDSEYDMAMAGSAGVAAVAVSYGVHACERLLAHGPVACIHHIRELPTVLAERRF